MPISANVDDQGCSSLQPLERGDDRLVEESAAMPFVWGPDSASTKSSARSGQGGWNIAAI